MKLTGVIPDHILKLMTKEDRNPMGKAGLTATEITQIFSAKREKEMHDIFSQWLNLNGVPFIHARTDKKSTIAKGAPDFTLIYRGKALCIEFKMPGQKITPDQDLFIEHLKKSETPVFICNMAAEAIELTRKTLKINL